VELVRPVKRSLLLEISPTQAARWLLRLPEAFLRREAAGGIALLSAALAAAVWANSPWSASYERVWQLQLWSWSALPSTLEFWINDGLMTAFFVLVGVEIRLEMRDGVLADRRNAMLPVVAALGGMAVPALIYASMSSDPVVRRGWGVPTATDIAFSLGILALLGKRVPPALRVLLLTLATVDDIGSVAVVAIFYHGGLSLSWGLAAAGCAVVLWLLRRRAIKSPVPYLVLGAMLWWTALRAGTHPALTGLLLGFTYPLGSTTGLRQWVAYWVAPLFALANAGVHVRGLQLPDGRVRAVVLGVLLARLLGKPVGILASSAAFMWARRSALPPQVTWSGMTLVGILAAIGLTVPIYIASIAFSEEALQASARFSLLAASAVAACVALIVGRVVLPQGREPGQ
jgi:NhaA family Na+:H+ antiporter